MLPVSADSPSIDSLEPCGQPEQRFPDQLKAGPELGTRWLPHFAQSVFRATSTEFPVRRSSLPAPTSCVQAFSLWPPIAGADHRSASDVGDPSVREEPDSPRPDMRSLPADGGSSSRQSSSRETKMGPKTRSSADTMNEIRGRSQHNHLNKIEFLNTTGSFQFQKCRIRAIRNWKLLHIEGRPIMTPRNKTSNQIVRRRCEEILKWIVANSYV